MPSKDKPKCPGTKAGTHEQCKNDAGFGTDHPGFGHCKFHGGSTPTGRVHAARLRGAALAHSRDISPDEALLEEVCVAAGTADWFAEQLAGYDSEEIGTPNTPGNGLYKLYQIERQHKVRTASAAIAAGVARRQVELAEQQGAMIALGFRTLIERLAELGMADELVEQAPRLARQVLLELPQRTGTEG